MLTRRSLLVAAPALCLLTACGDNARFSSKTPPIGELPLFPGETTHMRGLINQYADHNEVPRTLVHRVVQRESGYNAGARNGPYYGLMQILPATARTMGFRGTPGDLLDAETNLKFAVKYLRGAWLLSDGSYDRAVGFYSKGYYYEAKRRGMLKETGLV